MRPERLDHSDIQTETYDPPLTGSISIEISGPDPLSVRPLLVLPQHGSKSFGRELRDAIRRQLRLCLILATSKNPEGELSDVHRKNYENDNQEDCANIH
jgi:hypothetical protein